MNFQPAINPITDEFFFDDGTSTSQENLLLSPPQYVSAKLFLEGPQRQQAVLPQTLDSEQKPPSRSQERIQHQEMSSELGDDVREPIADEPRRKWRGSKIRGRYKAYSKAPNIGGPEGESYRKNTRRQHIRDRNRIAAVKSRIKKSDEEAALAKSEQAMEKLNRQLKRDFEELTAEIYHLKTQLLQHTDCNCILIQKYIAQEAIKSVDRLNTFSSPPEPNTVPLIGYHQALTITGPSRIDSSDTQTYNMESMLPTWDDLFPLGSSSSEVGENIFNMESEQVIRDPISALYQPKTNPPPIYWSNCLGGLAITGP